MKVLVVSYTKLFNNRLINSFLLGHPVGCVGIYLHNWSEGARYKLTSYLQLTNYLF